MWFSAICFIWIIKRSIRVLRQWYVSNSNENKSDTEYQKRIKNDIERIRLLKAILPYGLDTYAIHNKPTFIKVRHGSIMFIDIVSYCNVVSENTDVIVFLILKKIYDMMDSVIVKYKYIQKIETIGDAYMVVGNMDAPTEYQPEMYLEMVLFANELLAKIAHIGIPDRTIRLRIGIHAGSFVVSYYGKIRPRLCVIGKHVNIAARIQSTAIPNTIHISKEMYTHIERARVPSSPILTRPKKYTPEITYQLNRDVELKHIGKVDTYTIRGET